MNMPEVEDNSITKHTQDMLSEALMSPAKVRAAVLIIEGENDLSDIRYEGSESTCLGLLEKARALLLKDFLERCEKDETVV